MTTDITSILCARREIRMRKYKATHTDNISPANYDDITHHGVMQNLQRFLWSFNENRKMQNA